MFSNHTNQAFQVHMMCSNQTFWKTVVKPDKQGQLLKLKTFKNCKSSMVIEGMRPPVKFMINFRQISKKFSTNFPNFQKNLSGHQSNFLSNFSREIFSVKQKFTTSFLNLTEKPPVKFLPYYIQKISLFSKPYA